MNLKAIVHKADFDETGYGEETILDKSGKSD